LNYGSAFLRPTVMAKWPDILPIKSANISGAIVAGSGEARAMMLRTPEATVVPLIHHRPVSGLQGKFSLEYAAAAALLDVCPGFGSFTDRVVRRDAAQRLMGLVEVKPEPGGNWLLDGQLEADVQAGRVRARAGH
jgi:hypothetical protein